MPYINTTTTAKIDKDKEKILTHEIGKAIELISGKSEEWLMLNFNSEAKMAFRGTDEGGVAMLEVEILGSAKDSDKERLTARLCSIVTDVLGIDGERIYVKYREVECWGHNGINF